MSDGTPKQLLPRLIDPRRFAQQGVILRGAVPATELPRLREIGLVIDDIQAELFFALDEQRERVVTGQVRAAAQLQCQRCLDLMPVDLTCDLSLAFVRDEEAARHLPGNYDPWIAADEQVDLFALIEEEVLLNLPYVAFHDSPCGSALGQKAESHGEVPSDKPNPFQVLKQLKEKTLK